MQAPLIQIDAFADALLEGNPAAVVPLPAWPADSLLQAIAAENNLSETAFLVPTIPDDAPPPDADLPAYHLRWFTPAVEVDLCGHATLAGASYLFEDVHPDAAVLRFWARSGWLGVERAGDGGYTLDFPSEPPTPVDIDPDVVAALGGVPVLEMLRGTDVVCVVADADVVRSVVPDAAALARLRTRGVVVTAAGGDSGYDVVSRWFGADAGIVEDPVTRSAHSQIAPMWAQRLGRTELVARQRSARGGTVRCRVDGDRTFLTGRCHRYLEGTITLPD